MSLKENNSLDKYLDTKIKYIRKYYKKTNLLLELQFVLYEGFNIYIRLDYIKKLKCYRLSWFNLDIVDKKNIERSLNFEVISQESVEEIFKSLDRRYKKQNEDKDEQIDDGKVILSLFDKGKNYTYKFSKYIPKRLSFLSSIFVILFNSLPGKLQWILYELHAVLMNEVTKYEYTKEFSFDLFNGDIDSIFAGKIIKRGEKYYQDGKVKLLEKIDDNRYFAIVEGTEKYLVIIKNDEEQGKIQVYCSCPCEFYCKHICSVILAIRNNEIKRFYKIFYKNSKLTLIERVMNFNYLLCIGIVEDNFEIVSNDGEVELVPIFDSNNKCNWKVLEDDENKTLTKLLQSKIKDKK